MKLFIAKPDDRDTVLMILGRNGYTVRRHRVFFDLQAPAGAQCKVVFYIPGAKSTECPEAG